MFRARIILMMTIENNLTAADIICDVEVENNGCRTTHWLQNNDNSQIAYNREHSLY